MVQLIINLPLTLNSAFPCLSLPGAGITVLVLVSAQQEKQWL